MQINRNIARAAALEAMRKAAVDTTVRQYEEYNAISARWYTMCAPLNDVANSILVDAIGELRQSPKWKKKGIRNSCEKSLKLYKRYEDKLFDKVSNTQFGDAQQYFMDYMDKYGEEMKRDVQIMRISVSNALNRMKYRWDAELASWVFTAYNMLNIACRCFDAYFEAVRLNTGHDYSKNFYDGRLTKVMDAFKVTADSFDPNNEYDLESDEMCRRSVKVVLNRFVLPGVADKAADYAIETNPEIDEKYEDRLKAIDADKERVKREAEQQVGLRK